MQRTLSGLTKGLSCICYRPAPTRPSPTEGRRGDGRRRGDTRVGQSRGRGGESSRGKPGGRRVGLTYERRKRYDTISQAIGNTPFIEVTTLSLPRRCRLFAKEEYRNPTGSHYDREMFRFIKALEEDGKIEPGRLGCWRPRQEIPALRSPGLSAP